MTEEQDTTLDDQHKIDRGASRVVREPRGNPILVAGFVILAIGGMAYMIFTASNKNDSDSQVAKKEPNYRVSGVEGKPYIAPPEPPKAEQAPAQVTAPQPDTAQADQEMLQREAIRQARERQKELEERLNSPQVIMDDSSSKAGQGVAGTPGKATLTGEGDENAAFASRYGQDSGRTMRATQLENLHTLVPQGTMIPGILETAISSNLPGFTRASVAEDVYSFDGSTLLIPSGTALIGRYRSGVVQGQSRVFVIWQRMLRPDGVSMMLDSYGTDALGRSGVAGEVDTHFFERFGSTIMLSLIDGAIQVGVNAANDQDGQNIALNGGQDFSRAAEIALENSINIPPTINIAQGERINIFVGHDLDFSSAQKGALIVR